MKLERRTILITGGTSGIGLEFARQLLLRGNTVIVTCREQSRLEAARQSLAGLHAIQSDAGDAASIAALKSQVVDRFPALDVLINNAGIMRNLDFNQPHDLADLTRELEINLGGPIRMVAAFLPHLKTRPASLIVNVSSGLAFIPMAAAPVYCAAKAGLHSFTHSLQSQLRNTNVEVVELAPPGVETPLFRTEFAAETKGQKAMAPEVLVKQAIAGIEAGKREIAPGLANVLRIMNRVAPMFMAGQLAKMTKPR